SSALSRMTTRTRSPQRSGYSRSRIAAAACHGLVGRTLPVRRSPTCVGAPAPVLTTTRRAPNITAARQSEPTQSHGVRNMPVPVDLTGDTYGRLLVLERAPSENRRKTYYRCLCACGTEVTVRADKLRDSTTKSCGGFAAEVNAERARLLND